MSNGPSHSPQDPPAQSAAEVVRAFVHFLYLLRRRKFVVFSSIAMLCILGGAYYLTATRLYESHASLMVLQTGTDVTYTTLTSDSGRQQLIPTFVELFSKSAVVEGAFEKLQKLPVESRIDFISHPQKDWGDLLRRNLHVQGVRRTNMIEISYRSKHPQAAQAVVQALVESFLDFMEENHKNVSAEIVELFDAEREKVWDRLSLRRKELLQLGRNAKDLGLREGDQIVHPVVQRVVKLNEELVEVREKRVKLAATMVAIRSTVRQGGDLRQHLLAIEPTVGRDFMTAALGLSPQFTEAMNDLEKGLIENQAKLDANLEHYGPAHFKIVELKQTIRLTENSLAGYQDRVNQRLADMLTGRLGPMLIEMVEGQLATAWAHENELMNEYGRSEADALVHIDRMAGLDLLEHEVKGLENLHDTLVQKIANVDVRGDQSDVRVAIVSEPVANYKPVTPRLSLIGALCLMLGFGGGSLLVYFIDLLDDRFRSPEELREQIGAPVLAMVRKLPQFEGAGTGALQVCVAPQAVESEAFRTLRTALAFSDQSMRRVAMTSTEPGDGKTTILANLAASYAQSGKRVLLLDADFRRPGLSRFFGMRSSEGITDLLCSDQDLQALSAEIVQTTEVSQLDIIPCGHRVSDPVELLGGPRFAELLAWGEDEYDLVLVDCPPVLAASDAAIIGRLVDGVVLVVHPEKNHRRLVLRAVDNLISMEAKLVGVVANQVGGEEDRGYYGSGYGYGYGVDYSEDAPGSFETDDEFEDQYYDGDDYEEADEDDSYADDIDEDKDEDESYPLAA